MSVIGSNILSGASGQGGDYTIDQSLRLDNAGADNAANYLVRLEDAWTSDGNQTTWTISWWMKWDNEDSNSERWIYHVRGDSATSDVMGVDGIFLINEQLQYYCYTSAWSVLRCSIKLNRKFRDPSAWYHCMVVMDSTLTAAADRTKIYVNGVRETSFATDTQISQDQDTNTNMNADTYIGASTSVTSTQSFGGYIAEFYRIDGQALGPESFGETDTATNQWKPIEYTGSYGTNGFYLDFADSADLGDDDSGEGNDFTPTNLVATDQVVDSPTNNFCTINPLSTMGTSITIGEGNLYHLMAGDREVRGTFAMFPGTKWYWEYYNMAGPHTDYAMPGIANPTDTYVIYSSSSDGVCYYASNGYKYVGGASAVAYGAGFTEDDIIGIALNLVDDEITYYKNGVSQGAITGIPTPALWVPAITNPATSAGVFNFGQDSSFAGNATAQGNQDSNDIGDFYYEPPSGFLAMCTDNLSDPEIALPEENFNTVLYTGNGTSLAVTGVGFQPDMVTVKSRSAATSNYCYDVIRGAGERMVWDGNYAESSISGVTSFDSDGFTVGSETGNNLDTGSFVGWNWKAGGAPTADNSAGAGATPTAGSVKIDGANLGSALAGTIAATRLSANTTNGFSIVSYTGDDASSATIAHGLSEAPELVIIKSRDSTASWYVGSSSGDMSFTSSDYLTLNTNSGESSSDTIWDDTAPTSTLFTVGTNNAVNNTDDFIAYCFHGIEGYSKVGGYAANNSTTDNTFVYTGFEPAWLMVKCINGGGQFWTIWDNARNPYNTANKVLHPNDARAETTTAHNMDLYSNGFKPYNNSGPGGGGSTWQYIYYAVAESPFKTSNAR